MSENNAYSNQELTYGVVAPTFPYLEGDYKVVEDDLVPLVPEDSLAATQEKGPELPPRSPVELVIENYSKSDNSSNIEDVIARFNRQNPDNKVSQAQIFELVLSQPDTLAKFIKKNIKLPFEFYVALMRKIEDQTLGPNILSVVKEMIKDDSREALLAHQDVLEEDINVEIEKLVQDPNTIDYLTNPIPEFTAVDMTLDSGISTVQALNDRVNQLVAEAESAFDQFEINLLRMRDFSKSVSRIVEKTSRFNRIEKALKNDKANQFYSLNKLAQRIGLTGPNASKDIADKADLISRKVSTVFDTAIKRHNASLDFLEAEANKRLAQIKANASNS